MSITSDRLVLEGFHAIQARGILDEFKETSERRRRVEDVLGKNTRLTELVELGEGDFLIQVDNLLGKGYWSAIVDYKHPVCYVTTRDAAMALFLAVKHEGVNSRAYEYICKMLGISYES